MHCATVRSKKIFKTANMNIKNSQFTMHCTKDSQN